MRKVGVAIDNEPKIYVSLVLERGRDVEGDCSYPVALISGDSIIAVYTRNRACSVLAVVNSARARRRDVGPCVVVQREFDASVV